MIIVGPTTTVTPPPPVPPKDDPDAQPTGPVARQWHPRPKLGASWTSWTGESWEITSHRSPVYALQGATGLGMVDPVHRWSESPTVDGAGWDSARTGPGEVFMPVRVTGGSLEEFLDAHAAFLRSLDPNRTGVLRITRPDATWREVECRYVSGADAQMDLDPLMRRKVVYGVTWATGDPYWRGEPVSQLFENETPAGGFFPGPPFTLGKGATLAGSTTTNPGDVDAYPVWRVNGPFTGFSVGVGASAASVTITKGAGGWVEIDMHPRKLTILDETGVDRWDNITAAEFEGIPPGVEVDVTTAITSPGVGASVSLKYVPRYRRAW